MGPLRARKDAAEVEALRRAGAAADRVAAELQAGDIELVGRTEAQVSAELGRRLRAEGHHRVNFAIVAAGANAASPHHEPGDRVIREGEVVLCDFGGTMLGDDGIGYCSDITRCVHLGEPSDEMAEAYAVLLDAQQAAVSAAVVGTPCEEVDATARRIITEAGWGEQFIHRTGHGIGIEEHEDPYIVSGNGTPLEPGHAFSIEPGIYVPGPLRLPPRGHRGGRRRRARPAQPRRPRPRAAVAGRLRPLRGGPYAPDAVIRLDAATVLLQWAVGGLAFLWVTTRRREVSLGYGWLLRGTYGLMALGALFLGLRYGEPVPVRDVASAGVALASAGGARSCRSSARRRAWPASASGSRRAARGSPP